MKIVDYSIDLVALPVTHDEANSVPILGSFALLRLQTDEGVEGLGISRGMAAEADALVETITRYMERVRERDPLSIEAISYQQETRFHFPQSIFTTGAGRGTTSRAANLIDVALWDLKAKRAGMPLYQLLGGYRNRARCYASWRVEPVCEGAELAERARFLVDQGHTAMKFHVRHLDAKGLVKHMETLRDAVGPDVEIMVDAHHLWDVKEAINMGRALEPYRPYWLEDPLVPDDFEGMSELRKALNTRICSGERYHSLPPFARLVTDRCVDIVMCDLDAGGLTGMLKVAHLSEFFGLPVVGHLSTEVTAHAMAAVSNGLMVEYLPWANPLFTEPFAIEHGELVLPDRPGLGLELDLDAVERYRVA